MNEFYVGYQPRAPQGLGRFLRFLSIGILICGAVVAVVVAAGQNPFAPAEFDFGSDREYRGALYAKPAPWLMSDSQAFLLVNPGKFGFPGAGEGQVSLRGARIHNGASQMIEVIPGTLRQSAGEVAPLARRILNASVSLTGEIVDSKCHYGVMNPGSGRVHRDCAVRCLRGGVPPAFLFRDGKGELVTLLLSGPDGQALPKHWLDHIAEPVRLTGKIVATGPLQILEVEE